MDTVGRLGLDAGTPEHQRQFVQQLIAWAAERHPADAVDVTPAALLAEAGQILELLGDHGAALEVYRHAATADGAVEPDVRCFLHRALVSVGELAAARLVAEEVRRSAPESPGAYAMIGETYEKSGDFREAHRWLNQGLQCIGRRAADDGRKDQALDLLLLAIVRRRIRQALVLPRDEVDRLAELSLPGRGATTGER
jgi:tetratricopeptide (TPR) repeat protein